MSGILGTRASLLYDINLLLQIATLLLLVLGYKYVKDNKLRRHGLTMAVATILHTSSVLLIMVPSFIAYFGILIGDFRNLGVIITWIHAVVGILTMMFGIYLVAIWRFQPPARMICARKKWLMRPTLALWAFALILGITFYAYYYL